MSVFVAVPVRVRVVKVLAPPTEWAVPLSWTSLKVSPPHVNVAATVSRILDVPAVKVRLSVIWALNEVEQFITDAPMLTDLVRVPVI